LCSAIRCACQIANVGGPSTEGGQAYAQEGIRSQAPVVQVVGSLQQLTLALKNLNNVPTGSSSKGRF
jgi:hypothetical protein